jgi:hypothetical protein
MSFFGRIFERIKGDPTSPRQQPGKLTPEQLAERAAWLRTPAYQAVRRQMFDRMGIRVENAEPPNGPGDHDWLRSGQGR